MNWHTRLSSVLVVSVLAATALAEETTLQRANDLLRSGKTDEAIELLDAHLADQPEDTSALLALAGAHHTKGNYQMAVQLNYRAAATPWAAPTAFYNEACALSLLDRADDAYVSLQKAIRSGFLDFDLIATDTDLENLRAEYTIEYPTEQEYIDFKARNNVELAYKVITPGNYNSDKSYPALVIFAPGDGRRSADWAIEELIGAGDTQEWIVVYAIAPSRGWFTHPSHHALNDMLNEIRDAYDIEDNKYHLAGFAQGARVATTYSQMSKEYFVSLTTFTAWHWSRWDDEDLASGFGMPVRLVVGELDSFGRDMNSHAGELMGSRAELIIVSSDDHTLASVRNGRLLEYIPYGATQPQ